MKTPEQREHTRYRIEWEVEVSAATWDDVLVLTAVSVSRGGMFIKTSHPATTGSPVTVAIQLPDDNTVRLTGQVVRTVEPPASQPGFALRFDPKQSSDVVLLESMASAYASARPGAASIQATVITREVHSEAAAIEIDSDRPDTEAEPEWRTKRDSAPSLGGVPSVEYPTESPLQSQPTAEHLSDEQPRIPFTVASDSDVDDAVEGLPVAVDLDPDTAEEDLELDQDFASQPTRDVPPALDHSLRSGSYDVSEQIRLVLSGGDVKEAPLKLDPGASRTEEPVPPAPASPALEAIQARPTLEVTLLEGACASPEMMGARPTREAPVVEGGRPTLEVSRAVEPPAEVGRHNLPPIEQRRGSDEALAFGVDFGTSYTSIGLFFDGAVAVLEDDEGHPLTPTTVSYPEQGLPLVGWAAREQLLTQPSTTFSAPKRMVGRDHDDPNLQSTLSSSPVHYERGPGGQVVADVYGQPVTIIQVVAEVFRRMAAIGEARSGRPVRKVTLAAPVAFEEKQRNAIIRAARMGGIEVVAVIDEPVAAAIAFGASGDEDQLVAVYDFGGGTFDFTLLKAGGGNFDILGEAGDAWLGGDDFDLALANHVAEHFWNQRKIDLRKRQVEWQRLVFLCERAKRQLSQHEETLVEARGMALSLAGSVDLKVGLNRSLFADLCRDLVERSIETVETCFMLTGHEPRDVTHVVMTGGVSRIPMVHDRVQAFFDRDIPLLVNPEEAIVIGASRFARQTAGVFREG